MAEYVKEQEFVDRSCPHWPGLFCFVFVKRDQQKSERLHINT